jgi:mono/diheme cytochrome c family protein
MASSTTRSVLVRYAALATVLAFSMTLAGLLRGAAHAGPTPKKRTGDQVYQQQCASCHGAKGEGTPIHRPALVGDRSIGELARYIAQYMPPGAPKKLPAADAQKVAEYIHGAFYSPLARERNRPARVGPVASDRAPVPNAVADLVGSFRAAAPAAAAQTTETQRQGLRGEYFKTARQRGDQRILERVDPEIRFDLKRPAR